MSSLVAAPDQPLLQAYLDLAVALRKAEARDEAATVLRMAIRRFADSGAAHLALGLIHAENGDAAKAISSFRKALRHSDSDQETRTAAALGLADALRSQSNYSAAADILRDVIDGGTPTLQVLSLLTDSLARQGRFDEALGFAVHAAELDPTSVEVQLMRSWLLYYTAQYDAAVESFQQLSALPSARDTATLGLAQALRDSGRVTQAVEVLTPLLKEHPGNYALRSTGADLLRHVEQYDEALAECERLLEQHPGKEWDTLFLKSGILRSMRRYQDALHVMDRLIELRPSYPFAYFSRARLYMRNGDPALALKDLQRARELGFSRMADLYFRMGEVQSALDMYPEAVDSYTQCLAHSPAEFWAYVGRAGAYFELRESELAIADLQRADEISPNSTHVYDLLAEIYEDLGSYPNALDALNRALAAEPDNIYLIGRRGEVYHGLGDLHAALSDLDAALVADPSDCWTRGVRGQVYLDMRRFDEARSDLESVLSQVPHYTWFRGSLGELDLYEHRYQDAFDNLDAAAEDAPNDPWWQFLLGLTHQQLSHAELAAVCFERAQEVIFTYESQWEAARAKLFLALIRLATGDPEKALELYRQVLVDPPAKFIVNEALRATASVVRFRPETPGGSTALELLERSLAPGFGATLMPAVVL